MVVGHVRQELDWDDCDDLEDCDNDVISLTMFQPSVRRDQVYTFYSFFFGGGGGVESSLFYVFDRY